MHFTREPIIETIITPREGHRLVLRHTSSAGHEEFFVDMLEVVSFGSSCFFRSLDKPKPFIVPVSDYEVLEVREQRVQLKAPAASQKGIKIAGGKKDAKKEAKKEEKVEEEEPKTARRKRRTRKKAAEPEAKSEEATTPPEETVNDGSSEDEIPLEKPSLIPPPPTLISDSISRYKEMTAIEELALEQQLEPTPQDTDGD